MQIPKTPPNLWRSLLNEVIARPDVLSMDILSRGRCFARWILTLTPDGLGFSEHIAKMFRRTRAEKPAWMVDEVFRGADGCPESAAALAIIFESGWQRYLRGEDFYAPSSVALTRLNELVALETEIEAGRIVLGAINRTATTVIP